ncbi:MAG: DUF2851 family protein [Bacteroidales bacterium]|nr:DUF2851 family protein [Bacteroidales bacterium]
MTEAFLHYLWQNQMLDQGLTTTDGRPVSVMRPGELNRDAGPDFFNARLTIGGVEWAGNIEVHLRASDWNAHRHSTDKTYNSVVLHVVYEHDADIRLEDGTTPPTLELSRFLHPAIVANYDALMAPAAEESIPCARRVAQVPAMILHSYMDRLVVERIEAKSAVVRRLLEESRGGWEQTCYWLLAHYFGGKVNALPFELTAKATPPGLLARWRDNPARVEALLMGQAGMLEGYFSDEYPRQLQTDYEALRSGAGLVPIDGFLWRYFRIRPSAFPTIRLSQFAHLMSSRTSLFSSLLTMKEAREIENLFNCPASPYWDNHYQLDKATERSCTKRLGKAQADVLIVNAWVPLLFVYGETLGNQDYKEQALDLLHQLEAENNAVVRQWKAVGVEAENAAQSQALLQLKNHYCAGRHCLDCRIGHYVIKHIS